MILPLIRYTLTLIEAVTLPRKPFSLVTWLYISALLIVSIPVDALYVLTRDLLSV